MSTETISDGREADAGRRNVRGLIIAACVLLSTFGLSTSIVMVSETEVVLIERLGRLNAVYDRPEDRGLHFKLPWPFDLARTFDQRVQLFDPPGREIFTRDKKNITVDAYVCWRIAVDENESSDALEKRPAVRFFRSLGSSDIANARLDTRVRSILTAAIGQVDLNQLLTIEDSEQGPEANRPSMLEQLSEEICESVRSSPVSGMSIRDELGLEVIDVRIQRVNFPIGNQQAVFDRMKSERQKIAERYRSSGLAENAVIRSRADRQYAEIMARAEADAERIRGQAEAEATRILNEAHSEAPEFYESLRTLEAYRKIINERTTLVLSADSPMFKLLTGGVPVNPVGSGTADGTTRPKKVGQSETNTQVPDSPTGTE